MSLNVGLHKSGNRQNRGGSNTELNSQSILKRENIFLVTQWELDGGIVDSILERLRNGWSKV